MSAGLHPSRVDILELKLYIESKIGHEKAEKYFYLLNRFFSLKISKLEFDRLCIATIGRENVCLHNRLIRAVLKNASVAKIPPPKEHKTGSSLNEKLPNGYQRSSFYSLCRDSSPRSPRKGRTPNGRDRKFMDRPSPLGPNGKACSLGCEDSVPKAQEQQSATELLSLGSRPPPEGSSVEEGEEVEQASGSPSIYSRSPVRAPLGMSISGKETRKVLRTGLGTGFHTDSCEGSGELPDTRSLKTRLEQKLETEGLKISLDCVNLLNNSLDVYLKRLMKPALELAGSRYGNMNSSENCNQVMFGLNGMRPMGYVHNANRPILASLLDFRVAIESNPRKLGEDWPIQLEKVCLRASDQQ
jgi:hypothetical protein